MGEIIDEIKVRPDENSSLLREFVVQKLREKSGKISESELKQFNQKFYKILNDLINEMAPSTDENGHITLSEQKQNGVIDKNSKKKTERTKLPDKQFMPSNSLLTDLLETQHIRTIYHIFIVTLLILFLHTLLDDYLGSGTLNVGLFCIKMGFAKFHIAMTIWACLQVASFFVYFGFKLWATLRNSLKSNKLRFIWNVGCLISFIFYEIGFLSFAIKQVYRTEIGDACAMGLLIEAVRFLMKTYAFVRSNVPKVTAGKLKHENGSPEALLPTFGTYVYFLFAPTIVYRDNYPRTQSIRWSRAARNFTEVIGSIVYVSFILEKFLIPLFKDFGRVPMDVKTLIVSTFASMIPTTTAVIIMFFLLLHSWMNGCAELLRFADRTFYKDWWNAPSFGVYYRTWNIVVHDWLYTYIYKDMYEHVCKKSKVLAAFITFFISAYFHEIILMTSFRFFYPVLFVVFFSIGAPLSFINTRKYKNLGNILFWFIYITGNGIVVSLYCIEYAAHLNCNIVNKSVWDQLIPMSWKCYENTI